MPVLSIIIVTLREEAYLRRTLENLKGLTIPHEIIISDGGSKDGTLAIAREYTDKVIVWDQPRRQTFGEAKNAGVARASGQFVVLIDADVLIPEPQRFFEEIIRLFEDPKIVGATVPLLPWPENASLVDALMCAPLNWYYIISNNLLHLGNASGEFQMIRREALDRIGGYNERLAAGEDNEMFRQLARIGRTVSYRKLSVRHSLRRAHKVGWIRLYIFWLRNGVSVSVRERAVVAEWPVVR